MASHRPRRSAAQWRELIAEQLRSGLSAKQFCAENDLGYPSFQNWKNKLSAERSAEAAAPDSQAAFIELTSPMIQRLATDNGSALPVWLVELDLGGGICLRIANPV